MKRLIRREYDLNKNRFVLQTAFAFAIPVVIAFIYAVAAGFFKGRMILGMSGMLGGMILFTAPVFIWLLLELSSEAADIFVRDEREGFVYILCDQWYNRTQIAAVKYIYSMAKSAGIVIAFSLWVGVLSFVGDLALKNALRPDIWLSYLFSGLGLVLFTTSASLFAGLFLPRLSSLTVFGAAAAAAFIGFWMRDYPWLAALAIFVICVIFTVDFSYILLEKYKKRPI